MFTHGWAPIYSLVKDSLSIKRCTLHSVSFIRPKTLTAPGVMSRNWSIASLSAKESLAEFICAVKIGEEFDGVISSVTNYGFYVELPDTVEGLVPIELMKDDSFIFNEKTHELIGQGYSDELHIISYKIGDSVKVKLNNVNAEAREITFEL